MERGNFLLDIYSGMRYTLGMPMGDDNHVETIMADDTVDNFSLVKFAEELLDDEHGISNKAYGQLLVLIGAAQGAVIRSTSFGAVQRANAHIVEKYLRDSENIDRLRLMFLKTKCQDGRWYLPEGWDKE